MQRCTIFTKTIPIHEGNWMPTIEEIREKLQRQSPRHVSGNQSIKAMIFALKDDIRALRETKNWSWQDITGLLAEDGIKIAEATLRVYVNAAFQNVKSTERKQYRKRLATRLNAASETPPRAQLATLPPTHPETGQPTIADGPVSTDKTQSAAPMATFPRTTGTSTSNPVNPVLE